MKLRGLMIEGRRKEIMESEEWNGRMEGKKRDNGRLGK